MSNERSHNRTREYAAVSPTSFEFGSKRKTELMVRHGFVLYIEGKADEE